MDEPRRVATQDPEVLDYGDGLTGLALRSELPDEELLIHHVLYAYRRQSGKDHVAPNTCCFNHLEVPVAARPQQPTKC